MTLQEAITRLYILRDDELAEHNPGHAKACDLGIKALKRLMELRKYDDHNPNWKLPGETKE